MEARTTIKHGSMPTDKSGTTGWYAEIREGRSVTRRGYFASEEGAERSASEYLALKRSWCRFAQTVRDGIE
jgi:hypothetical protein